MKYGLEMRVAEYLASGWVVHAAVVAIVVWFFLLAEDRDDE